MDLDAGAAASEGGDAPFPSAWVRSTGWRR
ncbi:hypothetical protein J2S66_007136 [Saccharothrix longispora]|uniref:Uncharacterized protein n=1 Tax=Saccharothrix longispora TaxID=33920 RepID=A0ABU1Q764_9PSEU|nr:hypothetical protein [Saccharothrix longispora]